MPVKQGMLGKYNMRNHNKWTTYNIYHFFKDISEQAEHTGNIMAMALLNIKFIC